jgi:hypothetical protein
VLGSLPARNFAFRPSFFQSPAGKGNGPLTASSFTVSNDFSDVLIVETHEFPHRQIALSLKRMPNCALDNAGIVREAIYHSQSHAEQK